MKSLPTWKKEKLSRRFFRSVMMRFCRREAHAFTLLELMVVIVILGILAVFVVPRITKRPEDARVTKAKVEISQLENALELYYLDNGMYPTSLHKLIPDYMSVIPTCPSRGRDTYSESYRTSEDNKEAILFCNIKNHWNTIDENGYKVTKWKHPKYTTPGANEPLKYYY